MSRLRRVVHGVALNWVSMGTTALVAFFLSPFVVHHLGNLVYGVWILIGSTLAYMNLMDLGFRGAVTRYVSKGYVEAHHDEASRVVSAALWIRLWIGGLILIATVIAAVIFPRVFHIPAGLSRPAQVAVLMVGVNIALSLTAGVFGGVLAALHRFDITSAIEICRTVLRAGGVVWLLSTGHGIVALAGWELLASVGASAATLFACFRVYPALRIAFRRPESPLLRKLWNYSIWVFIINVAVQVVYYTDNVVIGAVLGASAVAFYAIGANLMPYARQVVSSMTSTFTPLASSLEAEGRQDHLRQLLVQGTRASLVLSLPINLALLFRGPTFIGLWMGQQYASVSGTVLIILTFAQIFSLASTTAGGIAYGTEKHRAVALWALGEAAANLGLSIFLIYKIGIYGVALGTTIPSLVIHILMWPRYICRLLSLRLSEYFQRIWLPFIGPAFMYGLGCYFADRAWHARNLLQFFGQILLLLPLFFAPLAVIFRKGLTYQLRTRLFTDSQQRSTLGA